MGSFFNALSALGDKGKMAQVGAFLLLGNPWHVFANAIFIPVAFSVPNL